MYNLQGDTRGLRLEAILLTSIWMLCCLFNSAWGAVNLAEMAKQMGNMAELPNQGQERSPKPLVSHCWRPNRPKPTLSDRIRQ